VEALAVILNRADIDAMESRYRAALINSVSGYKSANLIGTCDRAGSPNLAIMSSAVHLGSHPPLLMLVLRPTTARQHTLENILETGSYTINHVSTHHFEAAHQTAARYAKDVSEFDAVGLTADWQEGVSAPFVAEAAVSLGMKLREHRPLEINGTQLIIGEICRVILPDEALLEDGSIDLELAGSVALSGLDTYFETSRLAKLPYAKPEPGTHEP
jgi:flavin reductase (DIM6/NTAB) family NADH-FMN oxidoreductase RutF